MIVTLKLFAGLNDYLPAEAGSHALTLQLAEALTPMQLLDRYHVPHDKIHLLLVNGVYLHPEDRDRQLMQDGDVIAVWPRVAGG